MIALEAAMFWSRFINQRVFITCYRLLSSLSTHPLWKWHQS